MNALITGVAGFVGSTLADRLLREGARVTGLDCFTDYYPRPLKQANLATLLPHSHFRFVESSIQEADLDSLLSGTTHVFHLAAQAGVRKSWGRDFQVYTTNNIEATQVLLEAVVGRPVERLVYASSSSVYGDGTPLPMRETALPNPLSPYGVTKLAAEHLCTLYHANHGVPCVSLRYFTVYGPRQRPDMAFNRFIQAALAGAPITLYGDGGQTRDFTFVADAVAATAAAGTRGVPGGVYNVGGGARVSMTHVLEVLEGIAGRRLDVRREGAQKGDMRDTYADTTRARQDLGFRPSVALADGLRAEYEWLAASGGGAK
ncbi:MAG: strE [Acidobacteria bacterium]|nr:strE [Acidobacteriota bacterium]